MIVHIKSYEKHGPNCGIAKQVQGKEVKITRHPKFEGLYSFEYAGEKWVCSDSAFYEDYVDEMEVLEEYWILIKDGKYFRFASGSGEPEFVDDIREAHRWVSKEAVDIFLKGVYVNMVYPDHFKNATGKCVTTAIINERQK